MSDRDSSASTDDVRASVKEKYGQAAMRVRESNTAASCCGSSACCGSTTEAWDPITSDLYDEGQKSGIPAAALLASLGCGNPTALAELHEGETVLDLGSGGGIDVLLSAKRVGAAGKVYGLDMTDEMLALANENKRRAGATNVEFLEGQIEPTRVYKAEDAAAFLAGSGLDADAFATQIEGKFMGAFIRAVEVG